MGAAVSVLAFSGAALCPEAITPFSARSALTLERQAGAKDDPQSPSAEPFGGSINR